ncbi:MAG TPA: ATP-binding protein [Syntrophorhabdaceae bacterium]|jgi:signal transduction histidine kinase
MSEETDSLLRRQKELEIELEETKSLSQSRNKILETNIGELNDVYLALNEKIKAIRRRDARIKGFEAEYTRANKLSTLGEMAFSIAHEIKNPLIAIQGFAKRIGRAADQDRIQEYAKLIDNEAGRLTEILMKLLEFARMEEPKKETVTIDAVVDDTVLFMEHHLTRFKQVTLSVEKTERLPLVSIEKIHIQQALVNLLMNAAQAMPEGGPISIRTWKNDGEVCISVSDEGPGIPPENLERIFEPFFTTKKKGEGTGLGLSLTKRLVEANGGRINVENKPGKGCTFTVFVPAIP